MSQHRQTAEQIFVGGGEMGELMRSYDWSKTAFGPVEKWPQSLRSALSICLNSRFPIAIYWGADCLLLYNDAWRPIVGDKHPWSLGRPGREVWPEIWDDIGPEFASVLATGEGTFHNDELLSMYRFGYTEECFFDYTFNPIQGESGVVDGIINIVSETTYRVLNDRRAQLLREVASRTGTAKTAQEACALMAAAIRSDPADIPFSLLYLIDEDGRYARLCGDTELHSKMSPAVVDLAADGTDGWPIALAVRTAQSQTLDDVVGRFGTLPGSPWPEPPQQAMVLPIATTPQGKVSGVFVAAASPRRRLDDNYRDFFGHIVGHIATAIANARSYEEERRRAEQLAELDRAKTAFFSNVSHEFRTPLTLMLSPLEELHTTLYERLQPHEREQLQLIERNGLRLQKLVNTLLDFSRIEAGRIQAVYEPTDLAAFTAELASVFRSLIEKAGMTLAIDCPTLPELVYVDREMWEKIVLNLLSNAFKFTLSGTISVRLQWVEKYVELTVSDTGVGIPPEELPHLFERFHRVENSQGRSFEGSGIGLSLVHELVKLHGGAIAVSSTFGQGSCFTVTIPTGTAHLPPERIGASRTLASTALGATPYVEEAQRWLPAESSEFSILSFELEENYELNPEVSIQNSKLSSNSKNEAKNSKLLLADDNADMRDYIRRLLSGSYNVQTVADGVAALNAIHNNPPDLVLTDVMMPGMDGFELLRNLRSNPTTQDIPVILLSARAGEESRIEGLEAGADDYLIKPFSARELLARVEATLKLAQLRQETSRTIQRSEERYRAFVQQSSEGIWRFEIEIPLSITTSENEQIQHFYEHAYLAECNQVMAQMYGFSSPQDLIGAKLDDLFVPSEPRNQEYLLAFIRSGYRLVDAESYEVDRQGNPKVFLNNLIGIVEDGKLLRAWGTQRDITDRKQAEAERELLLQREQSLRHQAEAAEAKMQQLLASIRESFVLFDRNWHVAYFNEQAADSMRLTREDILDKNIWDLFPDLVGTEFYDRLHQVMRDRVPIQFEYYYPTWDRWFENRLYPTPDGVVNLCSDISDRKRVELNDQFLTQLDIRLRQLSDADAMAWEVVSSLGRYLNVDRCVWNEIDAPANLAIVKQNWYQQNDMPSVVGVYQLSDFALPNLIDLYHIGQTVTVADVTTHPYTTSLVDNYIPYGTRAYVAVPCVVKGNWVALLVVNTRTIRNWRADEVALMQEVVARLWSTIEYTRAVQELRQSEAEFRQLANAMPQIVYVSNANGSLEFINDRWTEYTGLNLEQSRALALREQLIPPEDREQIQADFAQAQETRSPYQSQFRLIQPNGSYLYFLTRAIPILNEQGQVIKWYGTSTDITGLKQLEEELRQRNAILNVINESSPAPIFVKDRQGRFIFANPATLEVLGKSEAEVIGRSDRDLYPLSEDALRVMENERRIMESGQMEVVEESPDGIRTFLGMKVPYRNEAGEVIGLIGISNDISDRVHFERDRDRILQQEQAAREAAERANRIKDEFLAVLSHELRSPLNPILGWSRLLRTGKLDATKTADALLTIERNAKLQVQLIDDLLDISRILRGKLTLNVTPVDLSFVILAALETVRLAAEAKSLQIKTTISPDVGTVMGDAGRLQQVVWNLLSNAVKFTPSGGQVEVKLSAVMGNGSLVMGNDFERSPITNYQLPITTQYSQIQVIDNGKGINPEFIPYVFEHFRQEDSATTRKFGGLGLGLAIARQIVEMHGGTIAVDSRGEGRGATFTVLLPLAPTSNQPPSLEPSSASTGDLSGIQILVVDDDTDSREFVTFVLEQAGATVTRVSSGMEALQAYAQKVPDLIVSDIGMPQMDGYMLMREIRAQKETKQVPAIALTAYAGEFDRQQALKAGFSQHIPKPVEPSEIIAIVARLCDRNRGTNP